MALIKCPECGKEISDKAPACIQCGFPLSLLNESFEVKKEMPKENVKPNIADEKGYSLELLDCGNKKVQVAVAIKSILKMKDTEALELVANTPCFLFKNKQDFVAAPIIKKLDTLPVEYKLYLDGKLKAHKSKEDVQDMQNNTDRYNADKIKCPKCSFLMENSSRVCPNCGFDEISSYILQIERKKRGIVTEHICNIDNTRDKETIECTKPANVKENVPRCPICQSTDINRVSEFAKLISVVMWGEFSQTVNKQWHCNNCESEW